MQEKSIIEKDKHISGKKSKNSESEFRKMPLYVYFNLWTVYYSYWDISYNLREFSNRYIATGQVRREWREPVDSKWPLPFNIWFFVYDISSLSIIKNVFQEKKAFLIYLSH